MEELINKLIQQKQYDKRLEPLVREFFLYNSNQHNWTEETLKHKIQLFQERIDGIEFVPLKDQLVTTDFDLKLLLLDEDLFSNMSYQKMMEFIADLFMEQEFITQDEIDVNLGKREIPAVDQLKYTEKHEDKESIIKMIANSFNVKTEQVYEIEEIFKEKLANTKQQDKETKDYLEECRRLFLPKTLQSASKILKSNSPMEKKKAYIDMYAISVLSLKYRLENKNEDKVLIKQQWEALKQELYEKSEEYAITMQDLEKDDIDSTWCIPIEQITQEIEGTLKAVPEIEQTPANEENIKIDQLLYGIRKEFLGQLANLAQEKDSFPDQEYIDRESQAIAQTYGEKEEPLIQEYFRRSAKIYHWTKEKFDQKLRNYKIGLEEVDYVKDIDHRDSSKVGRYSGKTIKINNEKLFTSNKLKLEVFFHESGHVTDRIHRSNSNLGEGIEEKYPYLNEYANEIGAIHLQGEKMYEDPLCFTHKMEGYEKFRYAGSMMAAALGISEFEFARQKDQGIRKFDQFFQEKFGFMNIEEKLEEFEEILDRIEEAPTIIYMKDMSEAYADLYHLTSEIIMTRLEYQSKNVKEEDQKHFEIKSEYEKTKLVKNIQLAQKKLNLKNKYIQPSIKENSLMDEYGKVSSKEKKQYLTLIEDLYPEKNITFDNKQLLEHINRQIRFPIIGKMMRRFSHGKIPRLEEGKPFPETNNQKDKRKKFVEPYRTEKTPVVLTTMKEQTEPINKIEPQIEGEEYDD